MLNYSKITYGGLTYADLPILPDYSNSEFISIEWAKHYNWTWLANTLYGDIEMAKDLMLINGVLDPFEDMTNRTIKIPRIGF